MGWPLLMFTAPWGGHEDWSILCYGVCGLLWYAILYHALIWYGMLWYGKDAHGLARIFLVFI